MTIKTDFKKSFDSYQARRGQFRIVDVPDVQYLMLDGHGNPNGPAFTEAIESLYPLAYKLKFASKRTLDRDYVVPPLEALWWAENMDSFTTARDKSKWHWTLMLMVPEWVGRELFLAIVEQLRAKNAPARFDEVRLETLSEVRCVQSMHVGSFDDEPDLLRKMHQEFIPAQRMHMTGKHHEIYLSDFRRVAPEKQRTILRQPVTHPPEG